MDRPGLPDPTSLRYSRQAVMKEVGIHGQEKLAAANVLVVGAGGLGSVCLYYLAAAGVGRLGIADYDYVSLSNLNRQILYTTGDLGHPKAATAASRLQKLNPEIRIDLHNLQINAANIEAVFSPYDVIVDAVDNLPARYLINDTCCALNKPLIEAAVSGFTGLLMSIIPGQTPCYRCLFPAPLPDEYASQIGSGIMGMTAGIIGSMQSMEAVKVILGIGSTVSGRFISLDGLDMHFEEIRLPRDPNCPTCAHL